MGIHDDNLSSFRVCSYDPAPSREELLRSWQSEGLDAEVIASNKNCMATELFDWLLQHVRVQREAPVYDPAKSLLGVGNSDLATAFDHYVSKLNDDSMLNSGEQQLKFDRKLYQGVTHDIGKHLIFLQILNGVVPGAAKRQSATSGRPEAAKRFFSGEEMSSLQEGLTLSVHHIDSDTTICLVIAGRQLDIVAETFSTPLKNCPLIAEALFSHAGDIIRLHLTDGLCKDVTLSVRLKKEEAKRSLLMKTPLQDQYKHTSRRYGSLNKQRGRLGAAAFLLDVVAAEEEEEIR